AGVGSTFMAVGLFAWSRQPRNLIGALLGAFAFVGLIVQFRTIRSPITYTIGALLAYVPTAILVHLLFAFPSGRIASQLGRVLVAAFYAGAFVLNLLVLLIDDSRRWGLGPGFNLILISSNPILHQAVYSVGLGTAILLLLAILVAFARYWRPATT